MKWIHQFMRSMFSTNHRYVRSYDALHAELTEVIRLAYEGIDRN